MEIRLVLALVADASHHKLVTDSVVGARSMKRSSPAPPLVEHLKLDSAAGVNRRSCGCSRGLRGLPCSSLHE